MRKEFLLASDLAEVTGASKHVLDFLSPLKLSSAVEFDIRLCLEEALINAIKYGNQQDRRKLVKLSCAYADNVLDFEVEDEGTGFDVKKVADCTRGDNLLKESGRGVHLICQLMDKVQYNQRGNKVRMTKVLASDSGKSLQKPQGDRP